MTDLIKVLVNATHMPEGPLDIILLYMMSKPCHARLKSINPFEITDESEFDDRLRVYMPSAVDHVAENSWFIPMVYEELERRNQISALVIHRLFVYAARVGDIEVIEWLFTKRLRYTFDQHGSASIEDHIMPINIRMLNYRWAAIIYLGATCYDWVIEQKTERWNLIKQSDFNEHIIAGVALAGDGELLTGLIRRLGYVPPVVMYCAASRDSDDMMRCLESIRGLRKKLTWLVHTLNIALSNSTPHALEFLLRQDRFRASKTSINMIAHCMSTAQFMRLYSPDRYAEIRIVHNLIQHARSPELVHELCARIGAVPPIPLTALLPGDGADGITIRDTIARGRRANLVEFASHFGHLDTYPTQVQLKRALTICSNCGICNIEHPDIAYEVSYDGTMHLLFATLQAGRYAAVLKALRALIVVPAFVKQFNTDHRTEFLELVVGHRLLPALRITCERNFYAASSKTAARTLCGLADKFNRWQNPEAQSLFVQILKLEETTEAKKLVIAASQNITSALPSKQWLAMLRRSIDLQFSVDQARLERIYDFKRRALPSIEAIVQSEELKEYKNYSDVRELIDIVQGDQPLLPTIDDLEKTLAWANSIIDKVSNHSVQRRHVIE